MKFGSDMGFGFMMFLKAIPFIFVYLLAVNFLTVLGIGTRVLAQLFLNFFVIPILAINFMNKESVSSFFEFRIVKNVFSNFGDYIMVMFKTIGLSIIFLIMTIILVGIPAGQFTKNIFIADFYRRRVK